MTEGIVNTIKTHVTTGDLAFLCWFLGKLTMGQMCEITSTAEETKEVHDIYTRLKEDQKL